MGLRQLLAALVAVAVTACGCGDTTTGSAATPVPSVSTVKPSKRSHIAVVVMENKEYSDVIGSRSGRYATRLARSYAVVPRFYAIAHPSLPNYLALTGGSTSGIDSDCTGCHVGATNLVDQLEGAGFSWGAYMDGMPRACFKGTGAGQYAKKHDPFMYYDDIRQNSARCAHVVPGGRLGTDLRNGTLPTFAWITPGLCEDTHDCSLSTGDRYLRQLVPALLRGLGPHGVLFVTWDEGNSDHGCCGGAASGGRIATIVAGPDVRRGASVGGTYDHYSTLRTIEDILGLPPLGEAGSSRPLDAAFKTLPQIRP